MYPTRGRPPALTEALEELLVLTFGAVATTNVERWALAFGAATPPDIPGTMRRASYETDVVGSIHRLGQRYWERRGEAAVWERPFPRPGRGRPPAVDIALFNAVTQTETRVEFGLFSDSARGEPTGAKLADDSAKLLELSSESHEDFPHIANYVVLWHEFRGPRTSMTTKRRNAMRTRCREFAASASTDDLTVDLLMLTGGHLFPDVDDEHHWIAVALFRVLSAD